MAWGCACVLVYLQAGWCVCGPSLIPRNLLQVGLGKLVRVQGCTVRAATARVKGLGLRPAGVCRGPCVACDCVRGELVEAGG